MQRYTASSRDREEYLADTELGRRALNGHHLASGGLSELYAPYSVERHVSPEHVLLLTRKGTGLLEIDNIRYTLSPHTLCLLPAGLTYRYWTDKAWVKSWFHLLPTSRWSAMTRAVSVTSGGSWDDLTTLMRLFLLERSRGRPDSFFLLDSFARSLALLVERELTTPELSLKSNQRQRIETMRRALYQEPGRPWNLQTLAAEFGFSPRNLLKFVNAIYGTGVMEMVTKIRMERAASLLLTTNFKLKEIAARVGYQDSFAFSRVFKRHLGISPNFYRQTSK